MNKLNFDDLFEFTKCNSTRANHPYIFLKGFLLYIVIPVFIFYFGETL